MTVFSHGIEGAGPKKGFQSIISDPVLFKRLRATARQGPN